MTVKEAYAFLEKSKEYGSVLGLQTMKTLLGRLGNPQEHLKFVHVAGTNGKGTTTAFIAHILAAAGYFVGRFHSPAVFQYREIIQLTYKNDEDGRIISALITEEKMAYFLEQIKLACDSMVADDQPHPTLFEIETAMAFLYYLDSKCDLVVLEVGLGGRLDATNVITTTECAVLTSISMDHMHILGNTLEQIALEKAGIIKQGITVVSYEQKDEARKVIEKVCKEKAASLAFADFDQIKIEAQDINGTLFSYEDLQNIRIKLLGENQVKNAVTAMIAIKALQRIGYSISEKDIYAGLFETRWSGRFEVLKQDPLFIVDGAHNEDAAISLGKNINIYLKNKRIIYIVGVLADKDYHAVLKHTGTFADAIITITPQNSRGLSSHKLAEVASSFCNTVYDCDSVKSAIEMAYHLAGDKDVILVFGSLSYLKDVYHELDITL